MEITVCRDDEGGKDNVSPHPSSLSLRSVDATFPAGEGFSGRVNAYLAFSILLAFIASIDIDEPPANLSLPQRGWWRADAGGVTDEEKTNTFQSPSIEATNCNLYSMKCDVRISFTKSS